MKRITACVVTLCLFVGISYALDDLERAQRIHTLMDVSENIIDGTIPSDLPREKKIHEIIVKFLIDTGLIFDENYVSSHTPKVMYQEMFRLYLTFYYSGIWMPTFNAESKWIEEKQKPVDSPKSKFHSITKEVVNAQDLIDMINSGGTTKQFFKFKIQLSVYVNGETGKKSIILTFDPTAFNIEYFNYHDVTIKVYDETVFLSGLLTVDMPVCVLTGDFKNFGDLTAFDICEMIQQAYENPPSNPASPHFLTAQINYFQQGFQFFEVDDFADFVKFWKKMKKMYDLEKEFQH